MIKTSGWIPKNKMTGFLGKIVSKGKGPGGRIWRWIVDNAKREGLK